MVLCFAFTVSSRSRNAPFAASRSIASLRWLAATLGAALLLTQLSSALHELLVTHRVCAEHGHRIHASDAAGPNFDRPAGVRGPAAGTSRGADSEHHEHCAAPARPDSAGVQLQRAAVAMLAPIAGKALAAPARVSVVAGPSILLVAPKQSPPA